MGDNLGRSDFPQGTSEPAVAGLQRMPDEEKEDPAARRQQELHNRTVGPAVDGRKFVTSGNGVFRAALPYGSSVVAVKHATRLDNLHDGP